MIFVASELVVECWCIRCFHSNLSQSKHKYIRCRTSQLPKNGFLLLESINCGYIIPSLETKLASYGSRFDQMSVSHLISTLSLLMPRHQLVYCDLQITLSILFFKHAVSFFEIFKLLCTKLALCKLHRLFLVNIFNGYSMLSWEFHEFVVLRCFSKTFLPIQPIIYSVLKQLVFFLLPSMCRFSAWFLILPVTKYIVVGNLQLEIWV